MSRPKKKKTRHPGLYRLGDGRYLIRPTVVCSRTGKVHERERTLQQGLTELEALIQLDQHRDALRAQVEGGGSQPPPPRGRMTVRAYAERWIEAKSARLKPSTAARYCDELAHQILPILGDLRVDAVTRLDVEQWVSWAESVKTRTGEDYSGITVSLWWRTLAAFLRDAAAEFDLPDPTRRVRPPERRTTGAHPRERRTLSTEQVVAFLEAVEAIHPQRLPELATMAWTGMRAGEIYGLRWENVDLEAAVIHVREAVWKGHLGAPKTLDPREIPIPEGLVELLRTWRQQQRREQLRRQLREPPQKPTQEPSPELKLGLVFPADNGEFRRPANNRKTMLKAAEEAGIPFDVTPQVLRRTYNTLLIRAGVDRTVLRSMMGHTTEAMTTRYAGVNMEDKRAAVVALAGATWGAHLGPAPKPDPRTP